MPTAELRVPDMRCEGCARSIRDALEGVAGVTGVDIALADETVSVEHDAEVTADELAGRIRERGFSPAPIDGSESPEGGNGAGGWYAILAVLVAVVAVAAYAGYAFYPRFDLPAVEGVGLLLLAAGAGVASFFSPCAFPLLVALLGRETGAGEGEPRKVGRGLRFAAGLSAGAAVFLLLVGVGIGLGGGALFERVTFTSTAGVVIRAAVGALLVVLGLVQLGVIHAPLHAVESLVRPLMRKQAEARRAVPTAGGFLFGFGYLLAGFG